MIQFVKSYQTTDGQTWPTIELAQAKELELLFQEALLVKKKEKVIDILTTTARSKPARKINKKKPEIVYNAAK